MPNRRTVILTGASRGIGHATVKRFGDAGWRIFTCSREDVPADCRRDPNWAHHVVADLADPPSRERFVAEVTERLDGAPIHALVNNAGVSPKTPYQERLGILHGELDGWRVLDAFAGSGALGFEAASRGAAEVLLLERDRALAASLNQSRERLKADTLRVQCADALAWMAACAPRRFELVFLDPPFDAGLFGKALAAAARVAVPDGFVYLEADREFTAAELAPLGLVVHARGDAVSTEHEP